MGSFECAQFLRQTLWAGVVWKRCERNTLMKLQTLNSANGFSTSLRAGVAAGLCLLMVAQPGFALDKKPKAAVAPANMAGQLTGDAKTLHALNRLTFGPRPGDVAAVSAEGLNAWFEQQLNPAKINDSALEARLANFPAMKMSQAELERRYPGPQIIRQMAIRGVGSLPTDPTERAIYADQIAFYKMFQAKQQQGNIAATVPAAGAAGGDATMQGGDMAGDNSMAPAAPATATAAKKSGKRGVDFATMPMDTGKKGGAKKADGTASEAGMAANEMGGAMTGPAATATPRGGRYANGKAGAYPGAQAVVDLPADQRMAKILAMQPQELIQFRQSLSPIQVGQLGRDLSPLQRETLAALQSSQRLIGAEALQSRLLRDIYSERQVEAVMTDFWLNHFNVYIRKNQQEAFLLPAYERDVIRPNALGKFEDLLVATAKSPAMLMYLDNWQSVGPNSQASKRVEAAKDMPGQIGKLAQKAPTGLNENYAREVMELHTLSVKCEVSADKTMMEIDPACGKGYTQQDVTQLAKVLTGWTIDKPYQGGGGFDYNARRHEPGSKTVLGVTIKENGEQEGMEVLHMLATSPATAKFISQKLAVRFVSDNPPASLVDRMAASFVKSDGDIKTVLRTMWNSPEFWAKDTYRAKVKTPLEFVASAARASGTETGNAMPLVQALDKLGMPLYGMATPNGYNWAKDDWVSTNALVARMNFALVLSANRVPGTVTDWTKFVDAPDAAEKVSLNSGVDPAALAKEQKLEKLILGEPASDHTRSTVLAQFQNTGAQDAAVQNFAIPTEQPEVIGQAQAAQGNFLAGPGGGAFLRGQGQVKDKQAAMMAGLLLGSPEFQRR